MKKYISLLLLFAGTFVWMGADGCAPSNTDKLEITPKTRLSPTQVEKTERFTIKSYGTFKAGYANSDREIFVMKDNKTGAEFIGITDCTLIKQIETKQNDAINDAVSAAVAAQ